MITSTLHGEKKMKITCNSKVAILMATYNGAEYIAEQLDSILKQSFTDWELYIHDDGSTDNTIGIVKSYVDMYPQKIHLIEGPSTGGAKSNFFFLMSRVSCDYVMFSDQDDYWLPDKIEKTFNKMLSLENNQEKVPVLVYTDLKVVDQDLNVIDEKMSEYQSLKMDNFNIKNLIIQNIVTGCTVMINRACVVQSLKCRDYTNVIMHDWWCALVASYFGKIGYVNESLILYRQHGDNSVGAKKIYSIDYIGAKLSKINDIRASLYSTQHQAELFVKTYDIHDKILEEYSKLNTKGKLRRCNFLIKNKIWKSGLVRNMGLLAFC